VLAFLSAVTLTGLTMLGFVPGLSALAGTARPADLGVRYGEAELRAALFKLERDTQSVDATLSEAELSAYVAHLAEQEGADLEEVQVRIEPDNRFEATAMVSLDGREYPLYIAGTAAAAVRGGDVESRVSKLRVAGLPVPANQRQRLEAAIVEGFGERLSSVAGLELESLSTGDGTVRIRGRRE
jgi:hypothetical protein